MGTCTEQTRCVAKMSTPSHLESFQNNKMGLCFDIVSVGLACVGRGVEMTVSSLGLPVATGMQAFSESASHN